MHLLTSSEAVRESRFHSCAGVHSAAEKLVGVTGFEPATSSSRTTRATKLRHTPCARQDYPMGRGMSVTRTASGGHAKRTGAKIDVPIPALTLSRDVRPP